MYLRKRSETFNFFFKELVAGWSHQRFLEIRFHLRGKFRSVYYLVVSVCDEEALVDAVPTIESEWYHYQAQKPVRYKAK